MSVSFDVTPYLSRGEGPHFDRKSLFEGPKGQKRARNRRAIRDQIAEYVAAFANAEGGVLILGIEDDTTITGHTLPEAVVAQMLDTPCERLTPPQAPGFTVCLDDHELLVFDVQMSAVPVMVVGDGYPLRMGESTVQAGFEQIQAMKMHGLLDSFEAQAATASLADLDPDTLADARAGAGLQAISNEEYLLRRRLADWRGPQLVLRQAAELLFKRGLPEHPNAGLRVFRVVGTERKTGLEHNVEELPRIEGPLPQVLRETYRVVSGFLRRPSRLGPDGRFRQTSEYPEFSWKEAVLNAVAHRDYRRQGSGVELWFFDDRVEVRSPGGLVDGVRLSDLLQLDRVHVSRNPRLVRGLVDLGFMRDQGEGIPRMFAEMEAEFLPPPEVTASDREVQVTLRNTMTLRAQDREFVDRISGLGLTPQQFRALFEANRSGRVDNAQMRAVAGLDTLASSALLRGLRDQGHLEMHAAGAASYYTLAERLTSQRSRLGGGGATLEPERGAVSTDGSEFDPDRGDSGPYRGDSGPYRGDSGPYRGDSGSYRGELGPGRRGLGQVRGEPEPNRWESELGHEEPPTHSDEDLRGEPSLTAVERRTLEGLGRRPRQDDLRAAIVVLTTRMARSAVALAQLLGDRDVGKLVKRHLQPMIAAGTLAFQYPDHPNHPRQAYIAAQRGLFDDEREGA